MAIVQTIKCKVFHSHEWQDWRFDPNTNNTNNCTMTRQCKNCGVNEVKQDEKHIWTTWAYLRDGDCEQERICTRCQKNDVQQANHKWTKWAYKEGSCEQERECKICHQQEDKKSDHDWTSWEYETEDACGKARSCRRCHKQESKEEHVWTDWATAANLAVLERHCQHCHSSESKDAHVVHFQRYYGSGVCDVCNNTIHSGEAYLVPTSTFYNSRKYREWLRTGPFSFMITMTGGNVDSYIAHARSIDTTAHSAVCPDCVYMFE